MTLCCASCLKFKKVLTRNLKAEITMWIASSVCGYISQEVSTVTVQYNSQEVSTVAIQYNSFYISFNLCKHEKAENGNLFNIGVGMTC